MKTRNKVVVVLAGYVLAFVVAIVVDFVYVSFTSGPDRQTYGAMFAFGDTLLFLAVFGIASLPATGAALYFLRASRSFWIALSLIAVLITATGLAAVVVILTPRLSSPSLLQVWASLSPIRVLVSPLFAIAFLLAGVFSPGRSPRITLLLVSAIEAGIFATTVLQWMRPGH